jgi:hypothetical protein
MNKKMAENHKASIQAKINLNTEKVKKLGKRYRQLHDCFMRGFRDDELSKISGMVVTEIDQLSMENIDLMNKLDSLNLLLRTKIWSEND